jgi:hypothetical protein
MYVSPIFLPEEVGFNVHADFSGCKICGEVYQSDLDRKVERGTATPKERVQATIQRKNWTNHHAKQHTSTEHRQLALSGRFCTPEAAHKLAAFGIVTLSDNVFSDEHEHAQMTADRLPTNEIQS